MAVSSYQSRDADIDIGRLFAAVWRDKWIILIGALVITALVAVALMLATPQYRSDARVLIDAGESVFTRPERDPLADQTRLDQEAVASQVEIIASTDLLMQVADQLDLASRTEFNDAASMSAFRRGLVALGLAADPSAVAQDKRVLDEMRERLRVYPVENSRVIVIEFRSSDPELAARVPNALAEAYVALESRAQLQNTGAAAD
ncbi:MAG: Wzz/FepE/Etk N-terminal domain-containing protein [Phyllobacteriaceae bacterium]|nr:Wzz/FepE/Etk N-terminal domain-containing protein [Phyllobacteriaceae bacterium]